MGRRKKFNRLPEAKQLAKQLLLHRVWNGKSQSNIADVLEVTFQQYQKIERCENRLMAEQLLKICKTFNWDPSIIEKNTPERLEMPFEIKRKEDTDGRNKETTSC
jgi:transcriptional regulator with XRE-family HTH domain